MVTTGQSDHRHAARDHGWATIELVGAIGILATTLLPLAFSFHIEQKLCRAAYFRALAMEIVDGETEVLAAGSWRQFKPGQQPYVVHGDAASNLPPGHFRLTVDTHRIRLQWAPVKTGSVTVVAREIELPPAAPPKW